MTNSVRTLEFQKEEFKQRKLLASPIAGLIAWTIVGIAGLIFPEHIMVWVLFIATGCIVYLAMGISKFTGEDYLDKTKPKNTFDWLFFFTVAQAILVYAIAIPFFLENHTSLPLTVGILTGLMWVPLTWIIDHWVGLFHTISRTVSIVVLWYCFPSHRFVFIPAAIVIIYLISIYFLVKRKKWKWFTDCINEIILFGWISYSFDQWVAQYDMVIITIVWRYWSKPKTIQCQGCVGDCRIGNQPFNLPLKISMIKWVTNWNRDRDSKRVPPISKNTRSTKPMSEACMQAWMAIGKSGFPCCFACSIQGVDRGV